MVVTVRMTGSKDSMVNSHHAFRVFMLAPGIQLLSTKTVRLPPKPTRSAAREIGTTVAVGKTSELSCDACSKLQIRDLPFFSDTCQDLQLTRRPASR